MTTTDILCGRNPLVECLRAGRRDRIRLIVQSGAARTGPVAEILRLARAHRVPVKEGDRRELDRITRGGHHQGVALEAGPYPYEEAESLLRDAAARDEPALLLLLDHIQDPQNLGALLRSADAAGVHGVILPRDRCAGVTPAVVRASSGAAEHQRIARVGNLRRVILDTRERGLRVWGLDASGEAIPYAEAPLEGPVGLVIGSEGEGLTRGVRNACDGRIRIPMRGAVASLNASVAGAVVLFHIRFLRRQPGPASHIGRPEN